MAQYSTDLQSFRKYKWKKAIPKYISEIGNVDTYLLTLPIHLPT